MLNVYKQRAIKSGLSGRAAEAEAQRRLAQAQRVPRSLGVPTKPPARVRPAVGGELGGRGRVTAPVGIKPAHARALSTAHVDHPASQALLHTAQAYAGHAGGTHLARPVFEGIGFKSIPITARHTRLVSNVTGQSCVIYPTPYTRSMGVMAQATGTPNGLVVTDAVTHQIDHLNADGTQYANLEAEGSFDIFGAGGMVNQHIYTFCGGFMRVHGTLSLGAVADYAHAGPDDYPRVGGRGSGAQNTASATGINLYNQAFLRYGVPATFAELLQRNLTTVQGPEASFDVVVPVPATQSGWWLMPAELDNAALTGEEFLRGAPDSGPRSGQGYVAVTTGGAAGETCRLLVEMVYHYRVAVSETHVTSTIADVPKATPPSHVGQVAGSSGAGASRDEALHNSVKKSVGRVAQFTEGMKNKLIDFVMHHHGSEPKTGAANSGHSELKQMATLGAIAAAPSAVPRIQRFLSGFRSGVTQAATRAFPIVEEVVEDGALMLL